MRLYGEIIPELWRWGLSTLQVHRPQTMLCLTCTIISSVDLAHYGVSRAIDWESVDCDTMFVLKAIKSNFKGSYDKQNLTRVVISYEIYETRQSLVS